MLRSSTRAPEGLKYRSSGSGYSWAPLRGAKILKAPLQPELKMPYAPLRSAPAPERSATLIISEILFRIKKIYLIRQIRLPNLTIYEDKRNETFREC